MSFIYRDLDFIKAVSGLVKESQDFRPPSARIDQKQLKSTALKLAHNIKQSLRGIEAPPSAELFQRNLFGLSSFLEWMAQNEIKYNGTVVVTTSRLEKNTVTSAVPDKYIRYAPYNVWGDGLMAFLKDLRKQASDSGNLYFSEMVANVIDEANSKKLYNETLDSEERKAPAKPRDPKDFSDVLANPDQVVDSVRSKINLKKNIMSEMIDLKVSDLTPAAFPKFISQISISSDGVNYSPLDFNSQNTDTMCLMLGTMLDDATKKVKENPKQRKYLYYGYQVYKFMQTKNCEETQEKPGDKPGTSKKPGDYEQISQQTQTPSVEEIGEAMSEANFVWPFDTFGGYVALSKIHRFVDGLSDLTRHPVIGHQLSQLAGVMGAYLNQLQRYIQEYTANAPGTAGYAQGFVFDINKDLYYRTESVLSLFYDSSKAQQVDKGINFEAAIGTLYSTANAVHLAIGVLNALKGTQFAADTRFKSTIDNQISYGNKLEKALRDSVESIRDRVRNVPKR